MDLSQHTLVSTSIYGSSHGSEHGEIYDIDYTTSIYGLSHGSQHGEMYDLDYQQHFHIWFVSLIITRRNTMYAILVLLISFSFEDSIHYVRPSVVKTSHWKL